MPRRAITTESWIQKAQAIHNGRYDYSKTHYINCRSNVTVICSIHGEFEINAAYHLAGNGCRTCLLQARLSELARGVARSFAAIHNYRRYGYTYDVTSNPLDTIAVDCPLHGRFYINVTKHLRGGGCDKCAAVCMKDMIRSYLQSARVDVQPNKVLHIGYMSRGRVRVVKETFDFYLPEYNAVIQCDYRRDFNNYKLKQHAAAKFTFIKNFDAAILRVSFADKPLVVRYVEAFIELLRDPHFNDIKLYCATNFRGYEDQGYLQLQV